MLTRSQNKRLVGVAKLIFENIQGSNLPSWECSHQDSWEHSDLPSWERSHLARSEDYTLYNPASGSFLFWTDMLATMEAMVRNKVKISWRPKLG